MRSRKNLFSISIFIFVLAFLMIKFLPPYFFQGQKGLGQSLLPTPTPPVPPSVLGEATKSTPESNLKTDQQFSPTPTPTPTLQTSQPPSLRGVTQPPLAPGQDPVSFKIQIQDTSRGASSDLAFNFSQLTGPETLKGLEIRIPSGWDIVSGNSVADGDIVGNGNLTFILNGAPGQILVTIVNSQDIQGHKAHWKVIFGNLESPQVTLDSFIDGDLNSGHKWIIDRKFLFDIKPPITFDLKILAKYTKKPENPGEFVFEQVANFIEGTKKAFSKVVSIF